MKKIFFYLILIGISIFAITTCSETHTVTYYFYDNSPEECCYTPLRTEVVTSGSYITAFDDTVLSVGATSWYFSGLLRDPEEKLNPNNIAKIKQDYGAEEFFPIKYGKYDVENPTKIEKDLHLYACYGERVKLRYYYFEWDGIEGSDLAFLHTDNIEHAKNDVIDFHNIPSNIINKRIRYQGNNYSSTDFAILKRGATPIMDFINKVNTTDSSDIYTKIDISTQIISADTDIYILYGREISIDIYKWTRTSAESEDPVYGYQKLRTISAGKYSSLNSTYDPSNYDTDLKGCTKWMVVNSAYIANNSISLGEIFVDNKPNPRNASDFSFASETILETDVSLIPVYTEYVDIKFLYYDGYFLTNDIQSRPSFKFKTVKSLKNNGELGNDDYILKVYASNLYTIDSTKFPTSEMMEANVPSDKRVGYYDDISSTTKAHKYPPVVDFQGNYNSDNEPKMREEIQSFIWGQVLKKNSKYHPIRVSECKVFPNGSSDAKNNLLKIVITPEIDPNAKEQHLDIIDAVLNKSTTAYLYAIAFMARNE